jgi:hypothetical protein
MDLNAVFLSYRRTKLLQHYDSAVFSEGKCISLKNKNGSVTLNDLFSDTHVYQSLDDKSKTLLREFLIKLGEDYYTLNYPKRSMRSGKVRPSIESNQQQKRKVVLPTEWTKNQGKGNTKDRATSVLLDQFVDTSTGLQEKRDCATPGLSDEPVDMGFAASHPADDLRLHDTTGLSVQPVGVGFADILPTDDRQLQDNRAVTDHPVHSTASHPADDLRLHDTTGLSVKPVGVGFADILPTDDRQLQDTRAVTDHPVRSIYFTFPFGKTIDVNAESNHYITLEKGDYERLKPGSWWNDALVDFSLQW